MDRTRTTATNPVSFAHVLCKAFSKLRRPGRPEKKEGSCTVSLHAHLAETYSVRRAFSGSMAMALRAGM
jgi:hypothetical protein